MTTQTQRKPVIELRGYVDVSPLHLEPATWRKLLDAMENGPGRPNGARYDAENPWHALIGDPTRYGCWVYTDIDIGWIDGLDEQLPRSLAGVLSDALAAGANYALFDVDVMPVEGWPVFDHDEAGSERPA